MHQAFRLECNANERESPLNYRLKSIEEKEKEKEIIPFSGTHQWKLQFLFFLLPYPYTSIILRVAQSTSTNKICQK